MRVASHLCPLAVALSTLLFPLGHALGDTPQPSAKIHTNRSSPVTLKTPPNEEESFHFIIFGDRTSGKPEGLPILAQAVKDANLLDPDLVMTIGDLVQGYNTQEPWEAEMREYQAIMNGLHMPWFPVAGNHDVYWNGDDQPTAEHEANYEKHFGPLWYWFEHKSCGFLILFSDEGDLDHPEKDKNFSDPAQHRFSEKQLAWLRESLQQMKGLKHIFVFQHHPRWASDLYPGSNWEEVHQMFVANGNVRACFAGHIHQMRHFGIRDGIEYSTLAATGGSLTGNGDYPDTGKLHHFNLVTVRPEGIHMGAISVGQTRDPKDYSHARATDLNEVYTSGFPQNITSDITLNADGKGHGTFTFQWVNNGKRPIQLQFSDTYTETPEWRYEFAENQAHTQVQPGETKSLQVTAHRDGTTLSAKVQPPALKVAIIYLDDDKRSTPLPPKTVAVPWTYSQIPESALKPSEDGKNSVLDIDFEWAAIRLEPSRVPAPESAFTIEAWARPLHHPKSGAIASKYQDSEYGLLTRNGKPTFNLHLGGQSIAVTAKEPLVLKQWTHVAGVFDGKHAILYVNGKEAARQEAVGELAHNQLPFYIGADPDSKGHPKQTFLGQIDEIRLSKTARYNTDFTPAKTQAVDSDTLLYFPLDRSISTVIPDHSASQAHGQLFGSAKLKSANISSN